LEGKEILNALNLNKAEVPSWKFEADICRSRTRDKNQCVLDLLAYMAKGEQRPTRLLALSNLTWNVLWVYIENLVRLGFAEIYYPTKSGGKPAKFKRIRLTRDGWIFASICSRVNRAIQEIWNVEETSYTIDQAGNYHKREEIEQLNSAGGAY